MNKILAHKDIELFKYIKKIELINQPIQLDILRDNIGDYWLIRIDGLEGRKVKFTIPSFIYGIIAPLQFTEQNANGIPTQVEADKLEERFDDTHWRKDDIFYYQFAQHRFLLYDNLFGELTIVGNGNALYGSASGLFSEITTKKLKFISFDIQRLTKLDYMFSYQYISSLDIRGIKFGEILDVKQMFRQQLINGTIDLTNIDLQKCETFKECFYETAGISKVVLPKTKIEKETSLIGMFAYSSDLKEINIEDLEIQRKQDIEYMFKLCYNLGKIDLSKIKKIDTDNIPKAIDRCVSIREIKLYSGRLNKQEREAIESKILLQQEQKTLKIIWEDQ